MQRKAFGFMFTNFANQFYPISQQQSKSTKLNMLEIQGYISKNQPVYEEDL